MAVTINDRLQQLFPGWRFGRRELIWLWLYLHSRGATPGNFDAPAMRNQIAALILQENWSEQIGNETNERLLAEVAFNWVEKKGRQPKWLLLKFRQMRPAAPLCPIDLTARDELIALFDFLDEKKATKLLILERLKADWVTQQLHDKRLAWYASAGKEREKCQIGWMWYQQHHGPLARLAPEFSKMEDILEFLDSTDFSLEEQLHHLEQVKKKFKALQTQASRRGKTQTNLSLSDAARIQLDELARRDRRTKTEVIENLIQTAYVGGMPQ